MKVLMVTGKFPSPSQTFVLYDFLLAHQAGIDVSLLSTGKDKKFRGSLSTSQFEKILYLNWRSFPLLNFTKSTKNKKLLSFFWEDVKNYGIVLSFRRLGFFSFLIQKFHDIDLIHAHFIQWGHEIGLPLSQLLGVPLVVTAHDGHILQYDSKILSKLGQKSSIILCPSSFQKKQWLSKTQNGNLKVLPNAIDIDKFPIRPVFPCSSGRVRLLVVSRLVKHKRVSDVIFAVSKLNSDVFDCELTIIGDGPERDTLEALVKRLSLSSKVNFLGFVPHDLVINEMYNSDIFIHPSENESFGIAVMEAMAAGLPVVVADSGGVRDFVFDGVTGLLYSPGNIPQLISHLRRLISCPGLASSLAISGREYVFSNFSYENHFHSLLRVWHDVLKC